MEVEEFSGIWQEGRGEFMKTFTIDIWENFTYGGRDVVNENPSMDAYILKSEAPRPAVLVLPGSGYAKCSPREAEALALGFNAAGFHAFVLWYTCFPGRHPLPVLDCNRAITIIKENAAEWHLDVNNLAMMGFSAGGHLALSQALFHKMDFANAPGVNPSLCGIKALMLCYPVICSGEFAHNGSFVNLLGNNPDPDTLEMLSLEKQIIKQKEISLPPVFLWHTYTDQSVPVENSLLLALSLRKRGIPLELHIFPEGKHGLSLANEETMWGDPANLNPHAAQWFGLCLNWLNLQFK